MHIIVILLGSTAWQFNFVTPSEADKAHKKIAKAMKEKAVFEIEDEFEQKAEIDGACVTAHQRSDLSKAMEGAAAIEMVRQRATLEFQQKASRDPQLMFLSAALTGQANGKGIIIPKA